MSAPVLIVGAGAAGLSAGYYLSQRGIDYRIVEASSYHGGRMKRISDFADFPLPLGGEWLHGAPEILEEIVNDPSVQVDTQTVGYDLVEDWGLYNRERATITDAEMDKDRKFVGSTWFDFFEQYIVPSVAEKITYDTVVDTVDYSADKVVVSARGQEFRADKVIVTVPLKMLQSGSITFSPPLSGAKTAAINDATVWGGCKAFIEFSEQFYPAFVEIEVKPHTAGERLYYNAAHGQHTSQNILGLFAVGDGSLPYVQRSGDEFINFVLAELDSIFENRASACYIRHTFQNWNEEPHAGGAYLSDHERWKRVRTLGQPVGNKLYFAGEAYTDGEDWGSVHVAARAAKRVVEQLAS